MKRRVVIWYNPVRRAPGYYSVRDFEPYKYIVCIVGGKNEWKKKVETYNNAAVARVDVKGGG